MEAQRCHFIRLLQAALEDAVAEAESLISAKDLQGLQKSASNAWNLYVKTRPPASLESVTRAKSCCREGVHPLLARALPAAQRPGPEAQVSRQQSSKS